MNDWHLYSHLENKSLTFAELKDGLLVWAGGDKLIVGDLIRDMRALGGCVAPCTWTEWQRQRIIIILSYLRSRGSSTQWTRPSLTNIFRTISFLKIVIFENLLMRPQYFLTFIVGIRKAQLALPKKIWLSCHYSLLFYSNLIKNVLIFQFQFSCVPKISYRDPKLFPVFIGYHNLFPRVLKVFHLVQIDPFYTCIHWLT